MSNARKRTINLSNANWQFCDRLVTQSNHFESVEDVVNYLLNSLAIPNEVNYALKVHESAPKMHESASKCIEVHRSAPIEPEERPDSQRNETGWMSEADWGDI